MQRAAAQTEANEAVLATQAAKERERTGRGVRLAALSAPLTALSVAGRRRTCELGGVRYVLHPTGIFQYFSRVCGAAVAALRAAPIRIHKMGRFTAVVHICAGTGPPTSAPGLTHPHLRRDRLGPVAVPSRSGRTRNVASCLTDGACGGAAPAGLRRQTCVRRATAGGKQCRAARAHGGVEPSVEASASDGTL